MSLQACSTLLTGVSIHAVPVAIAMPAPALEKLSEETKNYHGGAGFSTRSGMAEKFQFEWILEWNQDTIDHSPLQLHLQITSVVSLTGFDCVQDNPKRPKPPIKFRIFFQPLHVRPKWKKKIQNPDTKRYFECSHLPRCCGRRRSCRACIGVATLRGCSARSCPR